MTDERSQTLMRPKSKAARCLVRIMPANLKKEGARYTHHQCRNRNRSTGELKLCHLSLHCPVCHLPLLLSFRLFLSFRPHGWLLPPILLQGRWAVGWQLWLPRELVQSWFWKSAVSAGYLPSAERTMLTCLQLRILSSV